MLFKVIVVIMQFRARNELGQIKSRLKGMFLIFSLKQPDSFVTDAKTEI